MNYVSECIDDHFLLTQKIAPLGREISPQIPFGMFLNHYGEEAFSETSATHEDFLRNYSDSKSIRFFYILLDFSLRKLPIQLIHIIKVENTSDEFIIFLGHVLAVDAMFSVMKSSTDAAFHFSLALRRTAAIRPLLFTSVVSG